MYFTSNLFCYSSYLFVINLKNGDKYPLQPITTIRIITYYHKHDVCTNK